MTGMDPWLANRYAGTGTREPAPQSEHTPPHETRIARRRADALLREVSVRAGRGRLIRVRAALACVVVVLTATGVVWTASWAH
ncbi:hypothetical protein [Cellulomonas denverensis]|uniref:Uncharacterized protein n=1 Tax=Cellulomonas denverensis TaxID=264297 RepID=A0A7X6KUB2_9CELL|nr:hypothetical protein [Cellulomonas denverensis]NKY21935.1 hypothetical protein [Cellulomonas denverensis]